MKNTESLEWNAFLNGDVIRKDKKRTIDAIAKTAGTVHTALMPKVVFAAEAGAGVSTWNHLLMSAMSAADWLCLGVIIYAGTTWMFGNRTKALEFMIQCAIGYVIIRHAVDIRNFLRTL